MDNGPDNVWKICEAWACFGVQENTYRDWNLGGKNQNAKVPRLKINTHDTAEDVTSVWVLVSQSEVDENSSFVL